MKHTIKGYITAAPSGRADRRLSVSFQTWKPSTEYEADKVVVAPHSIEVEVPDNFDPRVGIVANLEEQKRQVAAEYAAKVTQINAQIQRLLAIENSATEAA